MTRTKERKGETVEGMDARIAEMETELAEGHGRPLSWDEVTSSTPEEIARKEQRRGVLPRLIRAAKVKRAELELRGRELEAERLRVELQPLYDAFQAKEADLRAAKEARNEAQGAWALMLSRVQGADERARRAGLELHEAKGER